MARILLVVLNAFVAISAIAGAIWVVPTMPLDWIKAGPFTDWTIPAFALGSVGTVAAVAAVALVVRPWLGALVSAIAGVAMIAFELVEIGVVGWTLADPRLPIFQASLQLVYLIVGSLQVLLAALVWRATRTEAPPIPIIHPAPA
ncbi:MAG TPA: hypothetical protein VLA76_02615 [Candidatus Angelobacter sp.]|nr:hypothetical protein [Candidatus Angelobacter sp.]